MNTVYKSVLHLICTYKIGTFILKFIYLHMQMMALKVYLQANHQSTFIIKWLSFSFSFDDEFSSLGQLL